MSSGPPLIAGAPERPVVLAAVARAHGLKGEVIVRRFSEESALLTVGRRFWVRQDERSGSWLRISTLSGDRLGLEGITDRTQAEALRGAELCLGRDELPDLAEDESYVHDLIGFVVLDAGGRALGTLEGILVSGNSEYFVIRGSREVLLPAEAPLLGAVDHAEKKLHLLVEVDPDDEIVGT